MVYQNTIETGIFRKPAENWRRIFFMGKFQVHVLCMFCTLGILKPCKQSGFVKD